MSEDRNTVDDCPACNARPNECSRGNVCCQDCNHAALWPKYLKLTPEQSKERDRIRQARLARSVSDIANEMELAETRVRLIPSTTDAEIGGQS